MQTNLKIKYDKATEKLFSFFFIQKPPIYAHGHLNEKITG